MNCSELYEVASGGDEDIGVDHREVGKFWNANAHAWTQLVRAGFDIYRDGLNTPAFLRLLPDVQGQRGLDIGCGEGHNTRLLAKRGARMIGVDIAPKFIEYAVESEKRDPFGIEYLVASAVRLVAEVFTDFDRIGHAMFIAQVSSVWRIEARMADGQLQESFGLEDPVRL